MNVQVSSQRRGLAGLVWRAAKRTHKRWTRDRSRMGTGGLGALARAPGSTATEMGLRGAAAVLEPGNREVSRPGRVRDVGPGGEEATVAQRLRGGHRVGGSAVD